MRAVRDTQHREFNQPLHVAYVDLKSAFDSVDRMALLWKYLHGIGVPQFLLPLIEDLHDGTTTRICITGTLSDSFLTTSGVSKGCILAPALFCRAIDWIMERVASTVGITIGNDTFTDLDYADDVALPADSDVTLRSALDDMDKTASHLGLHVPGKQRRYNTSASALLPPVLQLLTT